MLSFFKSAGAVHDLSFTGQEILGDKAIGMDGPKRKVLIVEERNGEFDAQMIDLFEISACTVKKVYSAIHSNEYRKNRPEDYLKSIVLEFGFKSGKPPVVVFFYKNESNSVYEVRELEARTKRWETMLSGMLEHPKEKAQGALQRKQQHCNDAIGIDVRNITFKFENKDTGIR